MRLILLLSLIPSLLFGAQIAKDLTVQGTLNGTPSSGTLDLSGLTLSIHGSAISSGTVAIARGGTGATTAYGAQDALSVKGADIASASTTNIAAATGSYLDITGTTTITAFGTATAGVERWLRFTAALTLTHNSTSLILPGGVNIKTVAGDVAHMISLGSGNWRCVGYQRINAFPGSEYPFLNVKDFGAIGDGSVNDTAAVQAAIDAAAARHGKVFFPAGTYSGNWNVPEYVEIFGPRKNGAHDGFADDPTITGAAFLTPWTPTSPVLSVTGFTGGMGLTIRDIGLRGPGAYTASSVGFRYTGAGGDFGGSGVKLDGVEVRDFETGVKFLGNRLTASQCSFVGCAIGFDVVSPPGGQNPSDTLVFSNCAFGGLREESEGVREETPNATNVGLMVRNNVKGISLIGCEMGQCGNALYVSTGGSTGLVSGTNFEANDIGAVIIEDGWYVFSGCNSFSGSNPFIDLTSNSARARMENCTISTTYPAVIRSVNQELSGITSTPPVLLELVTAPQTIASHGTGNPGVVNTTTAHSLTTGDTAIIRSVTGSTADVNGPRVVTVSDTDTFTIPVNVTVAGSGGTMMRRIGLGYTGGDIIRAVRASSDQSINPGNVFTTVIFNTLDTGSGATNYTGNFNTPTGLWMSPRTLNYNFTVWLKTGGIATWYELYLVQFTHAGVAEKSWPLTRGIGGLNAFDFIHAQHTATCIAGKQYGIQLNTGSATAVAIKNEGSPYSGTEMTSLNIQPVPNF